MPPNVIYFFIEGLIGATKTTLVERAAPLLSRVREMATIVTVAEPIEEWSCVLADFYNDPARWAFTFQVRAMSTRVAAVRRAIEEHYDKDGPIVVLCERSVYADRHVFVNALHDTGFMQDNEFLMYQDAFNYFTPHAYPGRIGGVIYMDSTPEACLRRIQLRGREAEYGLSLEYLEQLRDLHEKALAPPNKWNGAPVLRVNVDQLGHVPSDDEAASELATQLDTFLCDALRT